VGIISRGGREEAERAGRLWEPPTESAVDPHRRIDNSPCNVVDVMLHAGPARSAFTADSA
jgi:hypothetical protein